jgi:sucrose-6-phosphate hydrolase SacC (GH32 family)
MKAREIIVGDQHAAIGSGPSLQSFRARMIVDRRSIEVFAQDGTTAIAAPFARSVGPFEMKIEADGGELEITELSIARLRPSWDPAR